MGRDFRYDTESEPNMRTSSPVSELVERLRAGPDVREIEDGSGAWEMDPDETGRTMRRDARAALSTSPQGGEHE